MRGVLIERLGPMVWGATPQGASNGLEEFEATARLWSLAGPSTPALEANRVSPL